MGLQIHKDDGEVIKKTKAAIASSYGSTPGVTQGGVTKIRNKTIPIINPMVKSSNWPQSNYKKGKFSKNDLAKGQLKSEWIYDVSIFQNSNENIVRISDLKCFTDHILMFAIALPTYIKKVLLIKSVPVNTK